MPKAGEVVQANWEQGTVELDLKDEVKGTVKSKRPAKVLGPIAVHRSLWTENKTWGVTSVTTGYSILFVGNEQDALKIGEVLWRKAAPAFREEEPEEICKKLPGWVIPWVRECRRQESYVDPTTFMVSDKPERYSRG